MELETILTTAMENGIIRSRTETQPEAALSAGSHYFKTTNTQQKTTTFFFRVNSDCMINAGINCGDVIVVDSSLAPANGKIVIATLDGEMLIRRYERTFNKLYLCPETPNLSRLEVGEYSDCKIMGVVTRVLKSL